MGSMMFAFVDEQYLFNWNLQNSISILPSNRSPWIEFTMHKDCIGHRWIKATIHCIESVHIFIDRCFIETMVEFRKVDRKITFKYKL